MTSMPTEALPRTDDGGGGRRDTGTRTTLRALLVVVSLLLVAWSALTLVSLLARDSAHRSATYDGVRAVDLDLGFESVTVTGSESTTAVHMTRSYSWSLRTPTASSRVVGDRLLMTSHCSWDVGLGCSGNVRLEVPRGTTVRLHTGDGHLTVRGLTGSVDVSSGDGGLDVSDVTGPLHLRTGDGSIEATGVRSRTVDVHTGDGHVQLAFATAPVTVRADTGDGSVEVSVPRDGDPWRVDATTGDGSRTIDVATDPAAARRIELHTGDGPLRVGYGS
jgi:hypothetical protein